MTLRESIVSPFPPGSARKMDYTFPDWNANNGGAVTNQIRDRPGAQAANPSGAISGGATGSQQVGVVNGVSCVRMINGANIGGGGVLIVDGAGRFHLATLAAQVFYTSNTDDYGCHRAYMIARVTGNPGDNTDCGLEIVLGPNAGLGVIGGGAVGFTYQFDTAGSCSLVYRGNSGAVTTLPIQTVAQGFVNTNFHKFEYRFLSATRTQNGVVKIFLDDRFILSRSFGSVPDDLPLPTSPGANANNGYVVNVQTQGRNTELDVALIRVQRGPTEQAVIS